MNRPLSYMEFYKKQFPEDFEPSKPAIDIIGEADKLAEKAKKKKSLGVFVGESKTKLVLGRRKFKIKNKYPYSCEDPQGEVFSQETWPQELSDLEKMYAEFCEKAHKYMRGHIDNNGDNWVSQIIFPDFYYEVIPERFRIE